jgi:hypothetical protein
MPRWFSQSIASSTLSVQRYGKPQALEVRAHRGLRLRQPATAALQFEEGHLPVRSGKLQIGPAGGELDHSVSLGDSMTSRMRFSVHTGVLWGIHRSPRPTKTLDDIRARKIDVIVVYKVDRLTRSVRSSTRRGKCGTPGRCQYGVTRRRRI